MTWLRGPQPLNECRHLPEFLNPLPLGWNILFKGQLQSWVVGSCAISEVLWQGMTFVFYTLTLMFLEAKRDERYVLPPKHPTPSVLCPSTKPCVCVCMAPAVPRRPGQNPSWHSHTSRACTHTAPGLFPFKSLHLTISCQIHRSQSVGTKLQVIKYIGWTTHSSGSKEPVPSQRPWSKAGREWGTILPLPLEDGDEQLETLLFRS